MRNQRSAFWQLGLERIVVDGQCTHGGFEHQRVQPFEAECFRNIGHILFQSNAVHNTDQLCLKAIDV